ncbi:MAG: CaiB/BaiF CoA-transferase family protein [Thermodesulfobacteriota bacterium]|nr:CaiB/BaiF CoA-transferase family protein [Thermodesulfobacteriota bacterium]
MKAKGKEPSPLPLEGIRVLDLTRLIPGAYCTAILGDAGAEVIKIEEINVGDYERQIHPFIGPMASRFLILNRNKKSVALNLKENKGRAVFLEMASTADVLVEGFRPGAMKRLGLDYEAVRESAPRLIYCSISSFGQDGPYRDVVAHDINILGMAGYFDITGRREGGPVIPGVQISDSVAGMNAAMAILMAVIGREKKARGRYVDISMLDGVISWMFDAARHVFAREDLPGEGKGRLVGGLPNYNIYETRDGRYITVGSIETKFRNTLLKALGREDLVEDTGEVTSSRPSESDQEVSSFLRQTFLLKTRDEWMEILGKLNICVAPANSLDEGLSHPQVVSRQMVLESEHPSVGRISQIGSPVHSPDALTDADRLPAPRLGQHTRQVLGSLGYKKEEINDLFDQGIARGE